MGAGSNAQQLGFLLDVASAGISGDRVEEEDPVVQKAGVVAGTHPLPGVVEVVAALRLDAEAALGRGIVHPRRGVHGV